MRRQMDDDHSRWQIGSCGQSKCERMAGGFRGGIARVIHDSDALVHLNPCSRDYPAVTHNYNTGKGEDDARYEYDSCTDWREFGVIESYAISKSLSRKSCRDLLGASARKFQSQENNNSSHVT